MSIRATACLLLALGTTVGAWDVARTPPMGFNTWNLYHCSVDASILTQTAEAMVNFGLRDAGYLVRSSFPSSLSPTLASLPSF